MHSKDNTQPMNHENTEEIYPLMLFRHNLCESKRTSDRLLHGKIQAANEKDKNVYMQASC